MNRVAKAREARFSQRGSGIVEFALASTFLLTLIVGVFDFGRALYAYHAVANAARLGTRYAIVRGSACTLSGCPATNASIQTYVQGLSPGVSGLTTTTNWPGNATCAATKNDPGCTVTVTVNYTFRFDGIPFLTTVPLASTSSMIISH